MQVRLKEREKLKRLLLQHSGLITSLFRTQNMAEEAKTPFFLLGSTAQTIVAVTKLSSGNDYLKECYILARAVLEKLVNAAFILVCDKEERSQFTFSATIRKLSLQIEKQFSGELNEQVLREIGNRIKSDPDKYKSISKFVTTKGKFKSRWTERSLNDRIKIIGQRSKEGSSLFELANNEIYNDASQAVHGSLYGSEFVYYDLILANKKDEKITQKQKSDHFDHAYLWLYIMLSAAIHNAVMVITEKLGNFDEERDHSSSICGAMYQIACADSLMDANND